MKKIFKYQLKIQEKQSIQLPKNSQIIRVDDVDGLFFLWAIVDVFEDRDLEMEERFLEFYKTGQEMAEPINYLKYIGFCKLFIMQELGLYVFERVETPQPYTS